ncbi:phage major capsid protein [Zavarzinella formosa]|uniref:phage major capsid protein n=1 Tax=Zavarzinella formosa TaxID=360055 RepID=UPI0002DB958B|nr:Mu-like prophage major head subunit gpT family protein [Zavarzinella formosa]
MNFESYVRSLGHDPDALTPDLKVALQAAWRAHMAATGGDATAGATLPAGNTNGSADRGTTENARINAIVSMCGENATVAGEAIVGGWDLARTKMRLELDALRSSRSTAPTSTYVTQTVPAMYTPAGFHHRQARQYPAPNAASIVQASLMLRCGHEAAALHNYGDRVCAIADGARFGSMVDAAKWFLGQTTDQPVPNDKSSIAKMAFGSFGPMASSGISTASFANALADTVGRVVSHSYSIQPATWAAFASAKSVPDFRKKTSIRPSFYVDLKKVGPVGEIEHGKADDKAEFTYSVDTYARLFSVDRTTIINDDLGILDQLPPAMAKGSARTLATLVYSVMSANAGSFFGTGNKNYLSGGASALSVTSLASAVQKLREQKSREGDYLTLTPRTLLVSTALEVTGRTILNSLLTNQTAANAPTGNPFSGSDIQLVVEPRLGATEWYLFADPSAEAVVVAYLEGRDAPVIEQFDMATTPEQLKVTWRCVFDFGAALADPTGAVKSAGA